MKIETLKPEQLNELQPNQMVNLPFIGVVTVINVRTEKSTASNFTYKVYEVILKATNEIKEFRWGTMMTGTWQTMEPVGICAYCNHVRPIGELEKKEIYRNRRNVSEWYCNDNGCHSYAQMSAEG